MLNILTPSRVALYTLLLTAFFNASSCKRKLTIDKEKYVYIPYNAGDKIVFETIENLTDTISICQLQSVENFSKKKMFGSEFKETYEARSSFLNNRCDTVGDMLFNFLFLDDSNSPCLGLNLSYAGDRRYFFYNYFRISDSLSFQEFHPILKKNVIILNNRPAHDSKSDIAKAFWSIKEGLLGLETWSKEFIRIRKL